MFRFNDYAIPLKDSSGRVWPFNDHGLTMCHLCDEYPGRDPDTFTPLDFEKARLARMYIELKLITGRYDMWVLRRWDDEKKEIERLKLLKRMEHKEAEIAYLEEQQATRFQAFMAKEMAAKEEHEQKKKFHAKPMHRKLPIALPPGEQLNLF